MESWVLHRNNGMEYIGNEEVDFQITRDKTKALQFPSKASALDYKKLYDDDEGNSKWMASQLK